MMSETSENTIFLRFYLTLCHLMITYWNWLKKRRIYIRKVSHAVSSTLQLFLVKQLGKYKKSELSQRQRQPSLEDIHLCNCDYFHDYPVSLEFCKVDEVRYIWAVKSIVDVKTENEIFIVCSSCCQNGKCGNCTLLFCRGRHGIVPIKCVPHVQHVYFSWFNQSYLCRCRCL